jgi:hypothetical protein
VTLHPSLSPVHHIRGKVGEGPYPPLAEPKMPPTNHLTALRPPNCVPPGVATHPKGTRSSRKARLSPQYGSLTPNSTPRPHSPQTAPLGGGRQEFCNLIPGIRDDVGRCGRARDTGPISAEVYSRFAGFSGRFEHCSGQAMILPGFAPPAIHPFARTASACGNGLPRAPWTVPSAGTNPCSLESAQCGPW